LGVNKRWRWKRCFQKKQGREIKRKGRETKKSNSQERRRREKKEKNFFLGGWSLFTKLTFEATVLWNKTPERVIAPFVSLQSDSERMWRLFFPPILLFFSPPSLFPKLWIFSFLSFLSFFSFLSLFYLFLCFPLLLFNNAKSSLSFCTFFVATQRKTGAALVFWFFFSSQSRVAWECIPNLGGRPHLKLKYWEGDR